MPAYQDEKTKKWYTQFYYRDINGKNIKKKKRGFRTKKEAQQFELEFKLQQQGSPDMLLKDFVELFVDGKKNDWKPTCKDSYLSQIRNHIVPYFGEYPINGIKPIDIKNWQNYLIDKGLSISTIRKIRDTLSQIFNYAKKYYNLKENPIHNVEPLKIDKKKKINFWTPSEFKEFMQYVDNEDFIIAYETLYFTGLRLGELTGLTLSDFDFSVPKLTVNKNYQVIDGKGIFLTPKTPSSKRDVILPEELANHIKQYISKFYSIDKDERIFNKNRSSYGNHLRRICKEHGLRPIKIHDFRHSHASLLIELGYSPVLIAERLGHEDIKMTLNTYSHLYPSKQTELALDLNRKYF